MKKKPIVALIYDFDGTLSPGNMQEFGFIQAVGKTPKEFWTMSDGLAAGQDASNVLSYMKMMFDEARKNGITLRRSDFRRFGQHIQLYDGVKGWFKAVNEYGAAHGVQIEHYINSSGLKEIIEGSPIASEFKHIFACTYIYNEAGEAVWPGISVDYTAKTQFIFKISKGIFSAHDNKKVNESVAEDKKRIPYPPDDLLRGRRDRHPQHEDRDHVRRPFHRGLRPFKREEKGFRREAQEAETREFHSAGRLPDKRPNLQGRLRHHRQDQSRL